MRTVLIAPEVRAELGAEQVQRLAGDVWAVRVQCWECDGWLAPTDPAAIVLVKLADLPSIQFTVHAHPGCADSGIREITQADLDRRSTSSDTGTDVDVVATVWDTGNRTAYPVVLISHHVELLLPGGGSERRDGAVAALLDVGWHLVTNMNRLPPTGPAGYWIRYTHTESHAAAPGLLELIGPDGVETSAHVQPGRYFRPALLTGRVVVVQGTRYLANWTTKGRTDVKRAARDGLLVAGVIPAELAGPGNDITHSHLR